MKNDKCIVSFSLFAKCYVKSFAKYYETQKTGAWEGKIEFRVPPKSYVAEASAMEANQDGTVEGSFLSFQLPLQFLRNSGCKMKKTPGLAYIKSG